MKTFFTSDTHFYHANIIKYCNRPFQSVEEMNKALIDNWNSVVGNEDTVYHLGDFCWKGVQSWQKIREQLNGKIILIAGNHDEPFLSKKSVLSLFEKVSFQQVIYIDNIRIILNHYPFLCYKGQNTPGNIQLYGHVHSTPNTKIKSIDELRCFSNCFPGQYDVGVDNNEFRPISWEEIKLKLEL